MGIPVYITKSLAAASANNIALSQTPGAAGNLTLNGSTVVGGVAVLDTPRRVLLTLAGDETGKTITVYGTDRVTTGNTVSDALAGTTAGTISTTRDFGTVTRVAISAAAAGAITVGTSGVGATQWINPDYHAPDFNLAISVDLTGTANYTLQYTYDDYWTIMPGQTQAAVPTAIDDTVLVGETTDGQTTFAFPITGWRAVINSGTGSIRVAAVQSGLGGEA